MSHYIRTQPAFLVVHEKELVAALENHFGAGKVEVHDKPVDLTAYTGENASESKRKHLQAEKCHVVVRKETLAAKQGHPDYNNSNDLGYRRNGEKYDAFVDAMGFDEEQQLDVLKDYTHSVFKKEVAAMGFTYEGHTVDEHGRIVMTASQY